MKKIIPFYLFLSCFPLSAIAQNKPAPPAPPPASDSDIIIEVPSPVKAVPPPPPPAGSALQETGGMYYSNEQEPPRMPGCEDILDQTEKRKCCHARLEAYLDEHLAYPALALENRVEGLVAIRLYVEKDGSISRMDMKKDIGAGCGKELQRVVKEMPA